MLNYVRQFFKRRVFFHTLYLWNEVGDSPPSPPTPFPNCFGISDTSNSLSDWCKFLLTIYRLNLPRTQCLSYPLWERGCEHNSELKNHILFGFLPCVLLYVCYTFFEKCREFCASARAILGTRWLARRDIYLSIRVQTTLLVTMRFSDLALKNTFSLTLTLCQKEIKPCMWFSVQTMPRLCQVISWTTRDWELEWYQTAQDGCRSVCYGSTEAKTIQKWLFW